MQQAAIQYADLAVIDDILPSDFSPFRTLEYAHYLDFFDSALLSLEGWHVALANETFTDALAKLPIETALKARVHPFRAAEDLTARLAYITFLYNAATLLPYLEQRRMPFILQLYPGGGFNLDLPETDERLRRVLKSPLCRKVIVTQTISQRYVTDRIGCDPAKVEFIYGGVFDSRVEFDFTRDKRLFGRDKQTLDLCFVAHRYGSGLTAKGFDHFVEIARTLGAADPRLRFHVVGDYTETDLPLGPVAGQMIFHGRQPSGFFGTFYPRMDAIIAVNRPFAHVPGAFDGFPTGACIEAGFRGVLNCINDPLGLNVAMTDGKDCVLLDSDPVHSCATLESLLRQPSRLYDLAYANWRRFHTVFNTDRQLAARTRLIMGELLKPEPLIMRPRAPASGLDGVLNGYSDEILGYLRDQLRSHQAELRDTGRRHLDLIEAYRDLEKRHGQLMEWHLLVDAQNKQLSQQCQELTQQLDTLPAAEHANWRLVYRQMRSRIRRRLA